VAALSVRTARNRRTRTRMSGGVGGGGRNPPADPICPRWQISLYSRNSASAKSTKTVRAASLPTQ
jgi:hypothetical protein